MIIIKSLLDVLLLAEIVEKVSKMWLEKVKVHNGGASYVYGENSLPILVYKEFSAINF